MKIMFKKFKEEEGAALIISLLVLTVLSLLGAVGILTSSMEMKISGNEKSEKIAFYNAEAGINEAIALFEAGTIVDTDEDDPNLDLTPAGIPLTAGFSNYSYTIRHKVENLAKDSAHCSGFDCSTGTVVFYNVSGYKYTNAAISCNGGASYPQCGFPVYEITATGTNGTSRVSLVTEFTKNTLNLNSKGGLYADTISIGGNVNVTPGTEIFTSGTSVNTFGTFSSQAADTADVGMIDYLGINVSEFADYADLTYADGTNHSATTSDWAALGSDDDNPVMIFVDNDGGTLEQFASNNDIYGVLVVMGDLKIGGTFTWHGLIYVMGTVTIGAGNPTIDGGIMVDNFAGLTGNLTVDENQDILTKFTKTGFNSKIVSWKRNY